MPTHRRTATITFLNILYFFAVFFFAEAGVDLCNFPNLCVDASFESADAFLLMRIEYVPAVPMACSTPSSVEPLIEHATAKYCPGLVHGFSLMHVQFTIVKLNTRKLATYKSRRIQIDAHRIRLDSLVRLPGPGPQYREELHVLSLVKYSCSRSGLFDCTLAKREETHCQKRDQGTPQTLGLASDLDLHVRYTE
jgi:hypothetical protein